MKLRVVFLTVFFVFISCKKHNVEDNKQSDLALKESFRNEFLIGIAMNEEISSGKDAVSQNIILKQFNSMTPENVMKAERINPKPGVYNFKPADDFVEFGKKNKMFIIGHTLIWHNQTPDWFFQDKNGKPNTKEAQMERMRTHIETIAGRYSGKVQAWDVVNEVLDENGSYRPTTLG